MSSNDGTPAPFTGAEIQAAQLQIEVLKRLNRPVDDRLYKVAAGSPESAAETPTAEADASTTDHHVITPEPVGQYIVIDTLGRVNSPFWEQVRRVKYSPIKVAGRKRYLTSAIRDQRVGPVGIKGTIVESGRTSEIKEQISFTVESVVKPASRQGERDVTPPSA